MNDSSRRAAWQQLRPTGSVVTLPLGHGWDGGSMAVDGAVDAGAGVLLLLSDEPPSVVARAMCAVYAGCDATAVIGAVESDFAWMQQCGAVRDAMIPTREGIAEPARLLEDDDMLANMVAALVRSAARRTPIVIAGAGPNIAALIAQRMASQSTSWVFSAIGDSDPAAAAARRRLMQSPWMSMEWNARGTTTEELVRTLIADLDERDD